MMGLGKKEEGLLFHAYLVNQRRHRHCKIRTKENPLAAGVSKGIPSQMTPPPLLGVNLGGIQGDGRG
jgi:hypothetical protein